MDKPQCDSSLWHAELPSDPRFKIQGRPSGIAGPPRHPLSEEHFRSTPRPKACMGNVADAPDSVDSKVWSSWSDIAAAVWNYGGELRQAQRHDGTEARK